MNSKTHRARRNWNRKGVFTLFEALLVLAIISGTLVAMVQVLDNALRLNRQAEIVTQLSLKAHSELERLKAVPFKQLNPGEWEMNDLSHPSQSGKIIIKEIEPGKLVEIQAIMNYQSPRWPYEIKLTTLRYNPGE